MYNKESDLFRRIKKEVDKIPVIDLHTHLRIDRPNAKNLAELLFYHFLCWEFIASGKDVRKDLPEFSQRLPEDVKTVEKLLVKYIPYLEELKNTTTYWALSKIFKDLYDFDFQNINTRNWKKLYDKVLKTAGDDNWTEEIFRKRAKATIVVTLPETFQEFEAIDKKWIDKGLFSPSFGNGSDIKKAIGSNLSSGLSIKDALRSLFAKCRQLKIKSLTGIVNLYKFPFVFVKVSDSEADKLREKWLKEKRFSAEEENKFSNLVLEIADEMEFSWIIAFGSGLPFSGEGPGQCILEVNHNIIPELCKALNEYRRVKLFIYDPVYIQSQEVCTAARMMPNIYPMGFQWHGFFFPYIERMMEERLATLPMNKPIGFMSDAYSTEWFYGKLSVVRRSLTKVLSRKIEEGLYTEELALKIARRWLYDNPKEAYLGEPGGVR